MILLIDDIFCFGRKVKYEIFQAVGVRDAAWGSDWVGTPATFPRCLVFIIAMASKQITLTAGKFVPVSRTTMLNVWSVSCNQNSIIFVSDAVPHVKFSIS
jgi:hypothetical protein